MTTAAPCAARLSRLSADEDLIEDWSSHTRCCALAILYCTGISESFATDRRKCLGLTSLLLFCWPNVSKPAMLSIEYPWSEDVEVLQTMSREGKAKAGAALCDISAGLFVWCVDIPSQMRLLTDRDWFPSNASCNAAWPFQLHVHVRCEMAVNSTPAALADIVRHLGRNAGRAIPDGRIMAALTRCVTRNRIRSIVCTRCDHVFRRASDSRLSAGMPMRAK